MFEYETIKHHIGRSIIEHLQTHEFARFSEMRPRDVDTNLFTYHLKQLMSEGYVQKTDTGYTLGEKGLMYVDRVSSSKNKLRTQPKIITMLLIQNEQGQMLLQERRKQPYINTWTLPYGKIHIDDNSVQTAGIRESQDKLSYTPHLVSHVGDCYIVVCNNLEVDSVILSRTLAHIVKFKADDIKANDQLVWVTPRDLASMRLAPAIEEIVAATLEEPSFFFEEFRVSIR